MTTARFFVGTGGVLNSFFSFVMIPFVLTPDRDAGFFWLRVEGDFFIELESCLDELPLRSFLIEVDRVLDEEGNVEFFLDGDDCCFWRPNNATLGSLTGLDWDFEEREGGFVGDELLKGLEVADLVAVVDLTVELLNDLVAVVDLTVELLRGLEVADLVAVVDLTVELLRGLEVADLAAVADLIAELVYGLVAVDFGESKSPLFIVEPFWEGFKVVRVRWTEGEGIEEAKR